MKKEFNEKTQTYNLTELSQSEYCALSSVVEAADSQCFEDEDGGEWYSRHEFFCVLKNDEREALRTMRKLLQVIAN
jgi:hypothetical protein